MGSLPEIAWFVAAVVLVLLELVVPGVILVFFGLGAAITSLAVLPTAHMEPFRDRRKGATPGSAYWRQARIAVMAPG